MDLHGFYPKILSLTHSGGKKWISSLSWLQCKNGRVFHVSVSAPACLQKGEKAAVFRLNTSQIEMIVNLAQSRLCHAGNILLFPSGLVSLFACFHWLTSPCLQVDPSALGLQKTFGCREDQVEDDQWSQWGLLPTHRGHHAAGFIPPCGVV